MSNCTVCGRPKSGNLDPFLCVRCVNEKLAWNDPQNWLQLARSRIDSMESEITALRAALDQERADNEQLRYFATDIIEAVCAVDVDGYPVGPLSDEIVLGMAVHRGLLHSPGWPTALLSGRGEGESNA